MRQCDSAMATMRWRQYDGAIELSRCRYRGIILSPSRFRTVVIDYRIVSHRTVVLSSSHYRIVALWIIK
jgi:hypothetical protein